MKITMKHSAKCIIYKNKKQTNPQKQQKSKKLNKNNSNKTNPSLKPTVLILFRKT